jgi:hypothetical protein
MSENPEATKPEDEEFPDDEPTSQYPGQPGEDFPDEGPTDIVQTEVPPLHPDNEPDPDGVNQMPDEPEGGEATRPE